MYLAEGSLTIATRLHIFSSRILAVNLSSLMKISWEEMRSQNQCQTISQGIRTVKFKILENVPFFYFGWPTAIVQNPNVWDWKFKIRRTVPWPLRSGRILQSQHLVSFHKGKSCYYFPHHA